MSNSKKSYRSRWQEWPGYKTVVDQKSQLGILPSQQESKTDTGQSRQDAQWPVAPGKAREKERALPLPSDHSKKRDKEIGPTVYNKPRKVPTRTKSVPGEQYGHPTKFDYNYPRRRQNVTAEAREAFDAVADLFPAKRQNNQRGVSERYTQNYYRINKPQIQVKRRRWWRKKRLDPRLKRRKEMYRKYPDRYERRGQSPFNTPAERTEQWREDQKDTAKRKGLTRKEWEKKRKDKKKTAQMRDLFAEVREILGGNWPQNWNTQVKNTQPPNTLSQNFGPGKSRGKSTPRNAPYEQKGESLKAPNLDNKPQEGLRKNRPDDPPASKMPAVQVNNPTSGSGKVIPLEYYTQLVNNTQQVPDGRQDRYLRNNNFQVKRAATYSDIMANVGPDIRRRSQDRTAKLERVDTKNWIWTWKVAGGSKSYTVKIQALKKGNAKSLDKLNLKCSCTCPAWRWQGPEHWGKTEDYLKNKPRGTASFPEVRDPNHQHAVCKHVYAVLQKSKNFFVRPEKSPLKKLSSFDITIRVANRYLEGEED